MGKRIRTVKTALTSLRKRMGGMGVVVIEDKIGCNIPPLKMMREWEEWG